MNPSGPSRAYREGATRCPACGELMKKGHTPSAELDECEACEGLWLDWFDGEVHTIAVEHEEARLARGAPLLVPSSRRSSAPPPSGSKTCPRCSRALVAELYRFSDAKESELITGVELLRCPECAGAFVPRGSAHLLLDRVRESKTQTPWEAVRSLLRGLVQRLRAPPSAPE